MNRVTLVGVTTGELEVNHVFKGVKGDTITALETEVVYISKNNIKNVIKIIFFKGSKFERWFSQKGLVVRIDGEIHSFNKDAWGKRINEVYISPKLVIPLPEEEKHKNLVEIKGDICGETLLKIRESGRCVAEGKIRIKRLNQEKKYDYIHLVAFDDKALSLSHLHHGDKISIKGRIHSRSFLFSYEEEGIKKQVQRTALEVCIHELTMKRKYA